MARRTAPPDTLLARCVDTLRGAGIEAAALRRGPKQPKGAAVPDAWLRLSGPAGNGNWACEVKRRIERATIEPVLHRLRQLRAETPRTLLLTEYVTPPLAEMLRKHDLAFVDAAGNAYLRDDGLFVWVTHRSPKRHAAPGRAAIHVAGLKLLFALLRQRVHSRNQRELARSAGIALGGVARIVSDFERRGWIRRRKDTIELADPEAMLRRWDEGYAETLRGKLLRAVCRLRPDVSLEQLVQRIQALTPSNQVLVGGELGAALLTRALRPGTATLHLHGIEPGRLLSRLNLVPDPAGNVFLLDAFAQEKWTDEIGALPVALADPLLLRAELLIHPDERMGEIAESIRVSHVAPRWK